MCKAALTKTSCNVHYYIEYSQGTFLINISRYNDILTDQMNCNLLWNIIYIIIRFIKLKWYGISNNRYEVWNRRMYWKTITIACVYSTFFSLRYFDLVSNANYNLENTNIYIIVFPIQEFQRKDMSRIALIPMERNCILPPVTYF